MPANAAENKSDCSYYSVLMEEAPVKPMGSLSLLLLLTVGLGLVLLKPVGKSEAQARTETIAIIGTGNVGSTLGKIWAEAGHTIVYGSRTPDASRVRELLTETGHGATATTQAAAAQQAEIILIPVPPTAIPEVMAALGDLSGKIIVDPTNYWSFEEGYPVSPRDPRDSLAEQIQALAPGASVVKALNTLNYTIMEDPSRSAGPVTVPIAGDDLAAKQRVARLVEDVGLEPLDVGPLQAAEYLEEMLRLALGFREFNPGMAFDYYLRPRSN
jgi:predicted dinucleotide-binding enzyme